MKTAEDILALIAADSSRLHLLRVLREVGPEGAWIGAGFVRTTGRKRARRWRCGSSANAWSYWHRWASTTCWR